MKIKLLLIATVTLLISSQVVSAQAPAGSTGQCRDGSYTTAAKKSGACSGHKGVQTWFAASGSAPATTNPIAPGQEPTPVAKPAPKQAAVPSVAAPSPAKAAPAAPITTTGQEPTPAAAPRSSTPTNSSRPQAVGGGPGLVWVNTPSKVYHCPGTEYYGTTKNGKYMSEADAIAMGARADHNKPCPK